MQDPYDALSPHHTWGPRDAEIDCPGTAPDCIFTASRMRDLLGLTEPPVDLRVTVRNGSEGVASLQATGATTSDACTGTTVRARLRLRSTWFYVGVLSLAPPARRITYPSDSRARVRCCHALDDCADGDPSVASNRRKTPATWIVTSSQSARRREPPMTFVWFVVWLIADNVGSQEPLRLDPVNAWMATLILAIALDLGGGHARARPAR